MIPDSGLLFWGHPVESRINVNVIVKAQALLFQLHIV